MRKFRIHFTINDTEDYFIVSGDTLEEVREKVSKETLNRSLSPDKNNMWSEEIVCYEF